MHEDKYSNYSDNKLSTYSDGRTKSLSGEAFSSEKSDELCDRTDDESNRLSFNAKKIAINDSVYIQNISELITKQGKDSCTMMVSTNLFHTESKADKESEERMLEDREKRLNEIIDTFKNAEDNNSKNQCTLVDDTLTDKTSIKNPSIISEKTLGNDRTCEVLQVIMEAELPKMEEEEEEEEEVEYLDGATKEAEISRREEKSEAVPSRGITRRNSVQSEGTKSSDDREEEVKAKLEAREAETENRKVVTIAEKESKCEKCCCVVS